MLPAQWDKRLDAYRPGDRVELLVARRERLLTIAVVLGEKPEVRWQLELVAEPTEEQRIHRAAWLGHSRPPEGDDPSTQE